MGVREASVRVQSSGVPPGSGARSRCGVRSSPDLGVERKRRAPCTSRRGGGRLCFAGSALHEVDLETLVSKMWRRSGLPREGEAHGEVSLVRTSFGPFAPDRSLTK